MKRNLLLMVAVFASLLALPVVSATARAAQQERSEPSKLIRKTGDGLQTSATRRVEPTYPPLAKTARVSGSVVVEVTVDEEGKVFSARAISGHPLLKDAALMAARGWEFEPTTLNGVPVKVIGTITLDFNLYTKEDIEKMKQKIAENPGDADLYYELGSMYADSGKNDEALDAYRQALTLKPNHFEAWLATGDVEKRREHIQEALDAYRQAAQAPAPDEHPRYKALALTRIAEMYFDHHRYQEAVDAYNQVVAQDPNLTSSDYMHRAIAYLKLGDKESAMAQYHKLNAFNPELAKELLKQINEQQ